MPEKISNFLRILFQIKPQTTAKTHVIAVLVFLLFISIFISETNLDGTDALSSYTAVSYTPLFVCDSSFVAGFSSITWQEGMVLRFILGTAASSFCMDITHMTLLGIPPRYLWLNVHQHQPRPFLQSAFSIRTPKLTTQGQIVTAVWSTWRRAVSWRAITALSNNNTKKMSPNWKKPNSSWNQRKRKEGRLLTKVVANRRVLRA